MTKRLLSLHFLAREQANDEKLTSLPDGRYETGNWRVSKKIADAAIEAEIHLHERQNAKSWFAGHVDGWRRHPVETDRLVFRFKRDDSLRREELTGWGTGSEKKYVREK